MQRAQAAESPIFFTEIPKEVLDRFLQSLLQYNIAFQYMKCSRPRTRGSSVEAQQCLSVYLHYYKDVLTGSACGEKQWAGLIGLMEEVREKRVMCE